VPDTILHKKGPLSDDEWKQMRRHPVYAYEMLSRIAYLRQALDIPYCHHESWDGTGYPRGLREDQIPLAARIFTVVDVYDALVTPRPYHEAISEDQAIMYIHEKSGVQFDQAVVNVFERLRLLDRL
jgi:HD-GYP domain-containing protein (c-di-GMP phosphodiesterase class II)